MSSKYERKLLNILEEEYDWLAVRSAGSMGKGDVLGIKPGHENSPVVIEVKKISTDPFYVSSGGEQGKEQFRMMVDHADKGINSVYAVRHTDGSRDNRWQIHWLDGGEEELGIFRRAEGDTLDETFA